MSDLTRQTQQAQAARTQQDDRGAALVRTIQGARSGVAAALAGKIDPDQFLRALATDIRKTPHLAECIPETVLGGMFTAAQMGLEIGAHRGLAYLVPYRNSRTNEYEASLIIGYKGFVDLFYRAGAKAVQAFLVREGDVFRIGSDARIGKTYEWVQADPNSTARITGAVAQVITPNGGVVWEYLSAADIAKRHSDTSFWKKWPDEMSLKTAIRRLVATAPVSTDLRRAAEIDETVLRQVPGEQHPVARRLPDAPPAQLQAAPAQPAQRPQQEQERPKPRPPVRTPPQQQPSEPVEDDQRSQYADEHVPVTDAPSTAGEVSEEEWAVIERQQYEDELARQAEEEGR